MRKHPLAIALLALVLGMAAAAMIIFAGCSDAQLQSAQSDVAASQQVLDAATQATAAAQTAMAIIPTTGPAHDSAASALSTAETAQTVAAQALNMAQATVAALQTQKVDNPQTIAAVSTAASAIPGPWGLVAVAATPFALSLIQMLLNNSHAAKTQTTLATALATKDTAQTAQLTQVVSAHADTINQAVAALKVSAPVALDSATPMPPTPPADIGSAVTAAPIATAVPAVAPDPTAPPPAAVVDTTTPAPATQG